MIDSSDWCEQPIRSREADWSSSSSSMWGIRLKSQKSRRSVTHRLYERLDTNTASASKESETRQSLIVSIKACYIESSAWARDFCIGAALEPDRLMFLPDAPISLCISLGGVSVSHLGWVFLRWKPLRMSARRWSMMQPSSCGTGALRTDRKQASIRDAKPKTSCIFWLQILEVNIYSVH